MRAAHPATPPREFPVPPGIYFVRASPDRGLPEAPGATGAVLVPFRRGTVPTAMAGAQKKTRGRESEAAFDDGAF
jgi:membrane carboxypeptidase/penicillin-binding protein